MRLDLKLIAPVLTIRKDNNARMPATRRKNPGAQRVATDAYNKAATRRGGGDRQTHEILAGEPGFFGTGFF